MAHKLIVTAYFEETVAQTSRWLKYRWSLSVSQKFEAKLLKVIENICKRPTIGRVSSKHQLVRSVLVTRRNRLYYTIDGESIILLELFETKQNPKKNKYE
jgi:plasmid stabilization system protein ParE